MIRISADDGCHSDLKLADMCERYNVPLIFYWPVEWHALAFEKAYLPLSFYDADELVEEFKLGSHTITHRHLTKLSQSDAEYEIYASKVMLEGMFNTKINNFAPPRGYTNKDLTSYTMEVYGNQRLTKGEHLVHVHPDSGVNGNVHWLEAINPQTKELWLHTWELDKYPEEWNNLEKYLEKNT